MPQIVPRRSFLKLASLAAAGNAAAINPFGGLIRLGTKQRVRL